MLNKWMYIIAILGRFLFIIITSHWEDLFGTPFMDIDYAVYTDGAKYVVQNQSPFNRHTYRYTPILSYIMIPNLYYYHYGQLLFSLSDVACTYLVDKILSL